MGVTIRELSERSGVKVPTIRYYERQGLLPEPVRTGTGQRRYGSVDVARLRFVRFGRGLGLEVGEIRALIEMVGSGNGEEIVVLIEAVAERVERMRLFCVGLRSVSEAIVAGAIDEAGAFDRIVEVEADNAGDRLEEPFSQEVCGSEEATVLEEPHSEAMAAEGVAATAVESIAEAKPTTTVGMQNEEAKTPLAPPKRKRNRAKS